MARATGSNLTLLHGLTVTRQAVGVLENLPWLGGRPLRLGLRGSLPL